MATNESIILKSNEYLLREGDDSSEMYYLKSGTLGVYKRKGNVELQFSTISQGELVGEMSFLDNLPRSATVKALEDCELSVIPKEKLESYLASQPTWLKALHGTLVDRLRKANQRARI